MGQSLCSSSSKGHYYLTGQRKEKNKNGMTGDQPFPRGLTDAGDAGRGPNGCEEANTQPEQAGGDRANPGKLYVVYDLPLSVSLG